MDQLLGRRALGSENHVAEQILSGIVGSQVAEFPVIILRLADIAFFDRQISQLVQQTLADGRPLKRQQKDILRFLVILIFLVDGCHHGQDAHIADTSPVNGVRNFHRGLIVAFIHQLFNLFHLNVKLVLIHLLHLPIAISRHGNL